MPESLSRYSRQILFSEIGEKGQQRLTESRVLIVGCGALGTVQADILCRAGVGFVRLADRDFVEESNLQRQTLFSEDDALQGLPKAVAARLRLNKVNSQVQIEACVADVNARNIEHLSSGMDCILDGTDNFETRFLINDTALKLGIPWVYGAAVGSHGVSMTIIPRETPCLRCVFENAPQPGTSPTCDTAGVVAPAVTLIAALQAAEALKILTGNRQRINRRLLQVDVWENSWKQLEVATARDTGQCRCCGLGHFDFLDGKEGSLTTALCGRDSVQIRRSGSSRLDLKELAQRLKRVGKVRFNEFLVHFQVEQFEIAVFSDGRGIVRGTNDIQVARSVYARYIGA
jgi:molybdopterin/thiamine biosynthesis adenylyltransferase